MTGEQGSDCFLWKKSGKNEACLLGAFGETGEIAVPETLSGCAVTQIGAYCFSRGHLPEGEVCRTFVSRDGVQETVADIPLYLRELTGSEVLRIALPKTVRTVGAYAFYGCREMRELAVYPALTGIGSDAFLNCFRLEKLSVMAHVTERTGLKQILSQIKWQTKVLFSADGVTEAAFLFPEYEESYDEIGPAHIFELNLTGEGFRARQCFADGVLQIPLYDGIFPQACVGEPEAVLLSMAWCRLYYDKYLSEEARMIYESYIREHGSALVGRLLAARELGQLHAFFKKGYGSAGLLEDAAQEAARMRWAEGAAAVLTWKRELFPEKKGRYSFDD